MRIACLACQLQLTAIPVARGHHRTKQWPNEMLITARQKIAIEKAQSKLDWQNIACDGAIAVAIALHIGRAPAVHHKLLAQRGQMPLALMKTGQTNLPPIQTNVPLGERVPLATIRAALDEKA